jgi:teichuronic acid biosynthesis glycosyltransferase TuaG
MQVVSLFASPDAVMTATIEFPHDPCSGLVTIVIPAYNRDDLIAETLESIRQQTYTNWELIVVEDASTGATEQIVRDFGSTVGNSVSYFRNAKNLGAAETRNVAFRLAKGEYVATLDSDDVWLPDHLETVIGEIQRSGCDIGYAKVTMVDDVTGNELGVYGPSPQEVADFPRALFNRCFVVASATVMRRNVLQIVGAQSLEHKYCEDFDFFLRCVSAGVTFAHVDRVTCRYRKNHAGATSERLSGMLEEVAYTILRYSDSPAIDHPTCLAFAYDNFLLAARVHRRSDPAKDPTSDPMRSGQLLIEAWRLRPAKTGILARGLGVCMREGVLRFLSLREDRSQFRTRIGKIHESMSESKSQQSAARAA